MSRKILKAAVLPLLILTLALSGCDSFMPPSNTSTTTGSGSGSQATGIWVTGTGEVSVTPDVAILEVGVEAQEASVAAAQAKATNAMAEISDALLDHGVAAEDIQTQYFRIRERTRWDDLTGEETVTGYRVTNTVTAKIRVHPYESYTLDYKTGLVVEAIVEAGGDLVRIDDLSFTVDDPSAYYDEARELAMQDAADRAEKLADLADVKLGAPTYIAESAGISPVYGNVVYAAAEMAVPTTVSVPVSPGEVEVTLSVQVGYGIR